MRSARSLSKHPRWWRLLVTVLLLLVLAYLLLSHQHLMRQSATAVAHADYRWLFAALVASALTFLLAAAIYKTLALHRLRYGQTVLVELAASFANRLLPAGLGGLGLHGLYLHRRKHSVSEATAVVSINNLLGITAHLSLLAIVCLLRPHTVAAFSHRWGHVRWAYVVLALVALCFIIDLLPLVRRTLASFISNLARSVRRLTLRQLAAAYGMAGLLTATYTLALFFSARSTHVALSLLQVFIVFSIGMLAGTVTPTPGGLVGIEAGLYAGFISYGVPGASAAAATLVYRLCTYWLPLLPGAVALLATRHKGIV